MKNARAVSALMGCLIAGAASAGPANVKVVHASPDAPPVDITVNGAVAFANLPFQSGTVYAPLAPDTYNVGVNVAGTSTTVFSTPLTVAADTNYSVVAVGRVGTTGEFGVLPLVDNNTLIADRARIRFVHASPNAPAVDITLTDGTILFGNVSFRGVGDYISVPGGSYDLQVRVAGTSTVALNVPGVGFGNNTVTTVYAMGLLGGAGVQALAAVPIIDAIPAPGALAALGAGGVLALRRRR